MLSLLGGCAQVAKLDETLSYKTGTFVTDQQVNSFQKGKTTQDQVVAAIGYPSDKLNVSGKEVWRYPYNKINAIPFAGQNESFTTVIEFNTKGVLMNAYKANGQQGKSGNALLDAANGM